MISSPSGNGPGAGRFHLERKSWSVPSGWIRDRSRFSTGTVPGGPRVAPGYPRSNVRGCSSRSPSRWTVSGSPPQGRAGPPPAPPPGPALVRGLQLDPMTLLPHRGGGRLTDPEARLLVPQVLVDLLQPRRLLLDRQIVIVLTQFGRPPLRFALPAPTFLDTHVTLPTPSAGCPRPANETGPP